ncbi:MAG: hypothetical protein ACTS47_00215 [Candidatus Hodgkinia cicadicola]
MHNASFGNIFKSNVLFYSNWNSTTNSAQSANYYVYLISIAEVLLLRAIVILISNDRRRGLINKLNNTTKQTCRFV